MNSKASIAEAEKLNLTTSHFYYLLLAKLYKAVDPDKSGEYLKTAHSLARTNSEKRVIEGRAENS